MGEIRTEHPAFGKVRISHVNGRRNLFMVDYPQQHFVTLSISTAALERSLSNDWTYADKQIIEIALSEVQFARLISTPNTEGVPCTLQSYTDPVSGEYLRPKLPDNHVGAQKTFSDEISQKAKKVATGVGEALALVKQLLAGGPIKKSELQKVKDTLHQAHMNLAENLSFVVKQAEEAIETAVESGKAEVDAHVDYAMVRLGERALGTSIQSFIDKGGDVKLIGEHVSSLTTEKT